MANDIFLIPVDEDMFSETVTTYVPSEETPQRFSEDIRVWGIRNSQMNQGFYDSISDGDLLLFYSDFEYIGVGLAGKKFESNKISSKYWSDVNAELLFEVRSFSEINIPIEEINSVFGYSETFLPQSFRRVSNSARRNLYEKWDSVNQFEEAVRSNLESYS